MLNTSRPPRVALQGGVCWCSAMRSLALAVITALLLAVPAAAQSPPPTVLTFDGAMPGQYTATLTQRARVQRRDLSIRHRAAQPAELPLRALPADAAHRVPYAEGLRAALRACADRLGTLVGRNRTPDDRRDGERHRGRPVRVEADFDPSARAGAFDYVELRAEGADIGIDDLAISASPQPDSAVTSGPAPRTEQDEATIAFGANRPDGARFAALARRRRVRDVYVPGHPREAGRRPAHLPDAGDRRLRRRRCLTRGVRVDRARAAARDAGESGRDADRERRHGHDRLRATRSGLRVQRRRRRVHTVHASVHGRGSRARTAYDRRPGRGRRRPAGSLSEPATRSTCPTGARWCRRTPRRQISTATGSRTPRRRFRLATCPRWPAYARWRRSSRAPSTSSFPRPRGGHSRSGRSRASCR